MSALVILFAFAAIGADEHTTQRGPVTASVAIEPLEPIIGDTLTLTLKVEAEAGVELLMPEFGEALERFRILDFVPREEIGEDGKTIATQTYRLESPLSGQQVIPPILIEFVDRRPGQREAPEDQDAYELLTERLEFEVQSVVPENAAGELKPPPGRLEPLPDELPAAVAWSASGLVLLVIAAAVAAFVWWKTHQVVRRRSAYEVAAEKLARLMGEPLPAGDAVGLFYVKLSGIVRQYLEDRFDIRAPELTTEEFLASVADSPDLSRAHQGLLNAFLRQADLVKFAGLQPSNDDIEASISAARRFLDETRDDQDAPRPHQQAREAAHA